MNFIYMLLVTFHIFTYFYGKHSHRVYISRLGGYRCAFEVQKIQSRLVRPDIFSINRVPKIYQNKSNTNEVVVILESKLDCQKN